MVPSHVWMFAPGSVYEAQVNDHHATDFVFTPPLSLLSYSGDCCQSVGWFFLVVWLMIVVVVRFSSEELHLLTTADVQRLLDRSISDRQSDLGVWEE